jgi:hypothetical protein
MSAGHFKELLNVRPSVFIRVAFLTICTYKQLILLVGNYMNGTGIKGGAFGFRVSSINKVIRFSFNCPLCLTTNSPS